MLVKAVLANSRANPSYQQQRCCVATTTQTPTHSLKHKLHSTLSIPHTTRSAPPSATPSLGPIFIPSSFIFPPRCGSRGLPTCAAGETCIDDPFTPGCLTALDCPGYCVRLDSSVCGPVFGVACQSSLQLCVKDPREKCSGDACPGTCVFGSGSNDVEIA